MAARQSAAMTGLDLEKFRVRTFVERLVELGEVDIYDAPVPMRDLSALIESTPRAKLFRSVGPERFEMVSNIIGNRRRLAAAFGVDEKGLQGEYMSRLGKAQPIVEIPSADAPVHHTIVTGDDIDLSKLPFHLQHELDGGPYISSALDYSIDPATGRTNVGCRRLMLRSRTTMRSNLTAPFDLKRMYAEAVARKQRFPVSFTIGSHPIDFCVAGVRVPMDENSLIATMRGEALPMVRGVTNGILAPADAECIIEGYFDELGYREFDGPYGEFMGYYGPVHIDPVFHVTAITRRRDPVYQTILHSGRSLANTDHGNMAALTGEVRVIQVLKAGGFDVAAVRGVPSTNGRQHMRVALKRSTFGQARLVIAALFSIPFVKHAYVVDEDIDVDDDAQMEWAMSTRFRADRDLVVEAGFPPMYMDILGQRDGDMAKAGFDLTLPFDVPATLETKVPRPPVFTGKPPRFQSVAQALEQGVPISFMQLMEAVGSEDGQEISMELDRLSREGRLTRSEPAGEWQWRAND